MLKKLQITHLEIINRKTKDGLGSEILKGIQQAKGVTVRIQKTFTKTNSTAATIGGAVLLNSSQDAVFAVKAFTGGNVVLNENDTLQVTWSITLGSP